MASLENARQKVENPYPSKSNKEWHMHGVETRMGGWAVAQSPILGTTITLKRLRKRGYRTLVKHYAKVSPLLNEPLYTRTLRTVV
jgi:pyridoxine/pyridoxamine 5'-phosphate oxidase